MARRPRPQPESPFRFAFQGFRDGWYVLRADMTLQDVRLGALAFEGQVTSWLVEQRITPGVWSHFGSGNTGDYPILPNEDGTALCLLLKRPADVLRLQARFPTIGITPETLLAALQAEAAVHRFVIQDIALLAHAAIHRLVTTYGDPYPTWDELGGETRVAFLLQIRQRIEHPDQPVQAVHQAWIEQRTRDGWKYGGQFDVDKLTDPLLVPWKNLSERVKARYRLLCSVVASVAPLLDE